MPSAPNSRPSSNGAPFAEPRHGRPDQRALHDRRADADEGQGEADVGLAPAVAIGGVEHEDRRQHLMRELADEVD